MFLAESLSPCPDGQSLPPSRHPFDLLLLAMVKTTMTSNMSIKKRLNVVV